MMPKYDDDYIEMIRADINIATYETVPYASVAGEVMEPTTGEEILNGTFWSEWYIEMFIKFGSKDGVHEAVFPKTPEESCIYDWCVTYNAWEQKN